MGYTLVSSERSPFGRACRLFMLTYGIPFNFKIINFVDDASAASQLAEATPINRVPILIDGDRCVFDSRVIVNHLTRAHHLPVLSIDEENIVSSVYSAMDASIVLFLMKRDGFDVDHAGFFVSRQRERLPSNLKYVTPWASRLDPKDSRDWNFPSMALLSYLHWAEKRAKLIQLAEYPALALFLDKFSDSPGVSETSLVD